MVRIQGDLPFVETWLVPLLLLLLILLCHIISYRVILGPRMNHCREMCPKVWAVSTRSLSFFLQSLSMSLVCALSGQVPEVPVVSKYGHVFERDLITKALADSGVCPITNENLAVEELTLIKVSPVVKPRPVTATSVPGMLTLFQNEWDALMLETYNLKKALDQTRQELSQALYQHDAACRVIARIVKERDSARE